MSAHEAGPRPAAPDRLFCVKMHASRAGVHVSGAERIVRERDIAPTLAALEARARTHAKAVPDDIRLRVEPAGEPLLLHALPVSTCPAPDGPGNWAEASAALRRAGIGRADEAVRMLRGAPPMRGAMLVDADTLERLEPDMARGVRATRMDALGPAAPSPAEKNHFREALVLATKVQAAPGIVAELCVSDDPEYTTGYVATKECGYRRLRFLKEKGDPSGGRIFFYRGPRSAVAATIAFLQERTVLVDGLPPSPPPLSPSPAPAPAPAPTPAPSEGVPFVPSVPSVPFAPPPPPSPAPSRRLDSVRSELDGIREAGLWRECREHGLATGPEAEIGGRRVVVLSSNDYCDLARHPEVVSAAAAAAARWGAGSGGSRLLTGSQPPHAALERALARFKGTEDCVLFGTGYMANVGAVSAIVGKGDAVFSDALNHASIIDGCRLSGADVVVYRHLDMDDLDRRLARSGTGHRRLLVVSDGVFSMDGDLLDLPRFLDVCARHDAFSMVDEAHATGVVGPGGRGLCEAFGAPPPDLLSGTLSKALGSEGGFVCASRELAGLLRNRARPFIFSTSLPCPCAAAAEAALGVLEREPGRAAAARENAAFLASELKQLGVRALHPAAAIVPVVLGDEDAAMEASRRLLDAGFWIPAVRYPSVARGEARLRASVMSSHSREVLRAAAAAVAECAARAARAEKPVLR